MDAISQISLFAAFTAGLLSFISPCVLPLVPSYLSYITGLSVENLANVEERVRFQSVIILNSLLFIAGFSAVFIAFGASASLIGQVLYEYQDVLRKVGGILIIIFGLYLLGILKLKFFMTERRLMEFKVRPVGYLGSFLIGTAFAAGWTPCVGPVLGTILAYASTTDSMSSGVMLLSFYSLGLAEHRQAFVYRLSAPRCCRNDEPIAAWLLFTHPPCAASQGTGPRRFLAFVQQADRVSSCDRRNPTSVGKAR